MTKLTESHFSLKSSTDKAQVFKLESKRLIIGRSNACDIVIDDPRVSSIHAVIELGDKNKIYDMNSSNGTFVNDKSVIVSDLNVGDSIRLGNREFKFEDKETPELPPILNILDKNIPPIIETESKSMSEMPSVIHASETPLPQRPVAFKVNKEEAPSVVYPLKADPEAEFSEYIFEDIDQLYPIFNYEPGLNSVEVVVVFKDRVLSVDYLPGKPGTYYLKGKSSRNDKFIEYPVLRQDETFPFITIDKGEVSVQTLPGFEATHLGDRKEKSKSSFHYLEQGEILRYHKQDHQIFVRTSEGPPKVKIANFFRRDSELKRYIFFMYFFLFLFLGSLFLYPVDEELEKEKVPKVIRTIIYKPKIERAKLTASKNPAIAKTKEAPKVNQKSPVQKVKPTKPKVVKKKPQNQTKKKVVKKSGVKEAKIAKQVKKTNRNSPVKKNTRSRVKPRPSRAKTIGGSRSSKPARTARSNTASKSKGSVDVYRSNTFKSTISNLLAKGGKTSNVRAKTNSQAANTGFTDFSTGGSEKGALQKAKVSKSLGSLTGSTTGRIDSSRGTEGLVNKRAIFTAGIPSDTVVLGSMDPDLIRRILREHLPEFRYCYQRELDKSAREFSGRLVFAFSIGASGYVVKSGVSNAGGLPPTVRRCVLNVLEGIKFPEPLGGGTVEVKQPMNFYPNVR